MIDRKNLLRTVYKRFETQSKQIFPIGIQKLPISLVTSLAYYSQNFLSKSLPETPMIFRACLASSLMRFAFRSFTFCNILNSLRFRALSPPLEIYCNLPNKFFFVTHQIKIELLVLLLLFFFVIC